MTEDLSRHHGPVGNLLDATPWPDAASHYRLRTDQLDFYRENGYISGIRVLTDRQVLSDSQWSQFQPVPIELKRGEASLHHPLLVHGSFENRSSRPRRAAVINLCRDGTESDSNEPLLQGVPVVPRGTTLGGQFFPLLNDSQRLAAVPRDDL